MKRERRKKIKEKRGEMNERKKKVKLKKRAGGE